MKKCFEKLLSLLTCAALLFGLTVFPAAAADSAGECPSGGSHIWVARSLGAGQVCPGLTLEQVYCSKCQETRGTTVDAHAWSNWTVTPATCTENGSRSRGCTNCSATETQELTAPGHKLETVTISVTCTQQGVSYQRCVNCDYEGPQTIVPATGHSFVDDGNCTTSVRCSVCGAWDGNTFYSQHRFAGAYEFNADGHWQHCQNPNCTATSPVAAHRTTSGNDCTKGTSCTICGSGNVTAQQHNFTNGKIGTSNGNGHYVLCTNPGCSVTTFVSHTAAPGTDCTAGVKCSACGYTMRSGTAHSFGAATHGDSLGHERVCSACNYVEKSSHIGSNDDGDCTTPVTCTLCGFVVTQGYSGHDYSRTVWTNDGAGGHSSLCSHPGCLSKITGSHTGGTATCRAAAICGVCGAGYGTKNTRNHDGGTELRNAKAAAPGVAGYTGDTYCLGCGQQLASGSDIPALAEDHVHKYGGWQSDSTGHWHACDCGAQKDAAPHSFKDGKCTVCGEADPNYVSESEHIHSYDTGWSVDAQEHWHECTVCGHQADKDVHRFLNDACIECGMTYDAHLEEKEANTPAPPVVVTEKYTDVVAGAWYVDAVQQIVDLGLMAGHSETRFGPNDTLDRGQMAVILHRLAGTPAADNGNPFNDVRAGAYYADAVSWASTNGILKGDGASYKPGSQITRQELATILYRYAAFSGYDVNVSGSVENYADGSLVSGWAKDSMVWACESGIITGRGNNQLAPTATATRAEAATMLLRFINWEQLTPLA